MLKAPVRPGVVVAGLVAVLVFDLVVGGVLGAVLGTTLFANRNATPSARAQRTTTARARDCLSPLSWRCHPTPP